MDTTASLENYHFKFFEDGTAIAVNDSVTKVGIFSTSVVNHQTKSGPNKLRLFMKFPVDYQHELHLLRNSWIPINHEMGVIEAFRTYDSSEVLVLKRN